MAVELTINDKEIRESSVTEQHDEINDNARPKCFNSTVQECLFVFAATMAVGQSSFYTGSVIGVTARIAKDLHMNSAEITWITAGAALSSGAFLLTFGKLADMFGRRNLFITGMAGFAIVLLIIGFATSGTYIDVLSGVLGLFSAAVVPPAVGTLGAVYGKPSKRKNRAFACFSAGNALGFVCGGIISGVASHVYSWRATFWTLSAVYAITTLFVIWTVPDAPGEKLPVTWESFKKSDLLGTLLLVTGFGLFSSSLTLAGDAPDGWGTGYVIALFVTGITLITCFLCWQSEYTYALIPLFIWRDRNFSVLMAIMSLGFMGFSSFGFWIALYFQNIQNVSALGIAIRLLPMFVNGILVNVVCGLILHRVSNKLLTAIGAVSFTAAFTILGLMKGENSYWGFIFPAQILAVVGADIEFNVTNMYVMSSLPRSKQSVAGGIFNTSVRLCGNLSLGISTAIFNSVRSKEENGDPTRPYLSVFWFGAAVTGTSILLIPFLSLRTQGGVQSRNNVSTSSVVSAVQETGVE